MTDFHNILKKKTELLCKGIYLDASLIEHYKSQGIKIDFGRKGGAGPLGGRYFLFENSKSFVNVALWDDRKKTNIVLREYNDGYFEFYDERENGTFGRLKLINEPKFYSLKTSDGILMKRIALVHGIDCLSSTIYQKCRYWACGEACRFCGIELSLEFDTTILEKNYKQMNEVIAAAKNEGKCKHMTLTSGTSEEEDKGANRYVELLKGIKREHPDVALHVQMEPMEDLSYLNELKEAGADTIGIHIEVVDDILRSIITPGKSKIPYEIFEENWKHALEIFGKNQVDSYLLLGFGENRYDFLEDIEKIVSIGVIPFITPVRAIPGKKESSMLSMPVMNHNALLEIYNGAALMMKKYGVNPLENKAGCVRCGGCSAINEAYLSVKERRNLEKIQFNLQLKEIIL